MQTDRRPDNSFIAHKIATGTCVTCQAAYHNTNMPYLQKVRYTQVPSTHSIMQLHTYYAPTNTTAIICLKNSRMVFSDVWMLNEAKSIKNLCMVQLMVVYYIYQTKAGTTKYKIQPLLEQFALFPSLQIAGYA